MFFFFIMVATLQVIIPVIHGYAFLLISVVIYPGKACKRDCLKGNGTSNQQDSCHCRDFKGYFSLKDVLLVFVLYALKCMQITVRDILSIIV